MIQPNLNERYYADGGEKDIKSMMEDAYRESITINQSYWVEADIDSRFKAGDQQLWNEIYGNPRISKKHFNFNRIRSNINMVTGHQRKTRKSMVSIPIENSDQYTSDQISKTLFWATKRDNILETISDAFEGACTTGMNLLSVWMDYRRDSVNGDICVDNTGYNSYLMDPYWRKKDLSDCNYLWRRLWKSKKQLMALFPGREKEIEEIQPRGNRDGKFNYMPESYSMGQNNLIALDEFWYIDTRTQRIIEDVVTGDTVEYFGDDETLEEFVALDTNRIEKTIDIPTVKTVYCVDGRVFYHGENPYGHELHPIDRYPFIPVLGYYDPDLPYYPWRMQGIVRGLRDAQYLYNRRKIIELDIFESQINSGLIYEEQALVNPKDAFMTGQGKGVAVKAGMIGAVKQIEPPRIDPSMLQVGEALGNEIMKISGINEELLGAADDDKAGILSMLRQGAGLTTLQKLFDQLDYSQKLLGSIMIDMIQANFREGKISRITGEEVSPQFRQKAFQKFDIEVEDGLNTTTQKQMQFAQMWELAQGGLPITPEDLLNASNIQNKTEVIENMQKRQQEQAQQQQKQEAVQMEVLKAQIDDLKSRALANQGLGVERISRVEENRSLATQREAEAVENIASARLDKVRAIKELQEMDLNQIQRLLEIVNSLQLGSEESVVKAVDDSAGGFQEGLTALQNIGLQ